MIEGKWFQTDSCLPRAERWLGKRKFEIAEAQWLDLTKEDEGYPDRDYVIARATIDLGESEDDLEMLEVNGLKTIIHDLRKEGYLKDADLMVAEAYFDAFCITDANVATEQLTSKQAKEYIEKLCS